jgi:hypothetical protein
METEDLAYHLQNALNPRITELEHLMTVCTDEVIVLPEAERRFVLGLVLAELVPDYEICVLEQVEGVVDGRTADTSAL